VALRRWPRTPPREDFPYTIKAGPAGGRPKRHRLELVLHQRLMSNPDGQVSATPID
jgi:hypothetical protein